MVSIVIVTYNGMQWLNKCLVSCGNYPVIVVDNASTDGTVEFIEEHYPKIKLFKQTTNLGFGQANNLGISYALQQGVEHVFLLNQDAYIIDDCLEQLVAFQKQHPEFGVLSPIHTTASQDKLDENFSHYMSYRNNTAFYSDFVLGNLLKPVYQVPFVNAAAWLLSKKTLMTIGGFDPLFFHYGEDDNYCQRMRYHEFRIGVIPTSYIIHDREGRAKKTIKKFSDAYYKAKAKNYTVKYADINVNDTEKQIDDILLKINKTKVKTILKFKLELYQNLKKEEKLLSVLKPKILKSYYLNSSQGPHYLTLK